MQHKIDVIYVTIIFIYWGFMHIFFVQKLMVLQVYFIADVILLNTMNIINEGSLSFVFVSLWV